MVKALRAIYRACFEDCRSVSDYLRSSVNFVAMLAALSILPLGLLVLLYPWAYRLVVSGYSQIPHHEQVAVVTKGNWMVGEIRPCSLESGRLQCQHIDEAGDLVSGEGEGHIFSVRFDRRTKTTPSEWRCVRGPESVSCELLGP
jgi:hypothetical protein